MLEGAAVKVVQDARRVKMYVGKHRKRVVRRSLGASGVGAVVLILIDLTPWMVQTVAILGLLAMMAVPSEFVAP